jgi:hypothetical protein
MQPVTIRVAVDSDGNDINLNGMAIAHPDDGKTYLDAVNKDSIYNGGQSMDAKAGMILVEGGSILGRGTANAVTDAEISAIQSSQAARISNSATYSELKQAAEFLKNNGLSTAQRREVIEAFNPGAQVVTLEQDLVVYRYYGGAADPRGRWVTTQPLTDPVNQLALPPGSTAENVTTWVIPKGTQVLQGEVAPNFGRTGGANQIYIPDKSVLTH